MPSASGLPSGYVRLERESTVVIIDAGTPPPLELAHHACAGCLSFELSAGDQPLLVNAGAPRPVDAAKRSLSRATAHHNTLSLNEQSSAKLMRNARLEQQLGSPPLVQPDNIRCEVRDVDGCIEVEASHDGYAERFGLIHTRTLKLDAAGCKLEGLDRLSEAKGVMRYAFDLPFAVHFHVHPAVQLRVGQTVDTAELLLADREHWRLSAAGGSLGIEPSTHFADTTGPRRTQQIVLRASCYGTAEIAWTLERIRAALPNWPHKPYGT